MTQTTSQQHSKRNDIQGLRAWAIILVLIFHFFPAYCPNGYIGVDMFFVISGFLIGMILCKYDSLNHSTILNFYYRRLKRIFPLYYLAIMLIYCCVYIILPDNFIDINTKSGMKAITLTKNLKIRDNGEDDYEKLLEGAEDLFTHTWSLCVEIQWYCLVPIVFMMQRFVTKEDKSFFIVIGLISLTFYKFANATLAFNCVLARIWQFCSGVLAYLITAKPKNNTANLEHVPMLPEKVSVERGMETWQENNNEYQNTEFSNDGKILPYISNGIVFLILICFTWAEQEEHNLRIEVTFLTAALIAIGHSYEAYALSNQVMAYIGNISYSLYLVHWPIYVICKHYFNDNAIVLLIGLGISFLLAAAIYHFYEQQYLKFSKVATYSLIASLFIGCLLMSRKEFFVPPPKYMLVGDYSKLGNPAVDLDAAATMNYMEGYVNKPNHLRNDDCIYKDFKAAIGMKPLGLCEIKGPLSGKYDILVIGNSYAANHGALIYSVFKQFAKSFRIFSLNACQILHQTSKSACHQVVKFEEVFDEFKPDILFIIDRVFTHKSEVLVHLVEKDKHYREFLGRAQYYMLNEKVKKIYILQAIPSCVKRCGSEAAKYLSETKKPLSTIGMGLVHWSNKDNMVRQEAVFQNCEKCHIINYTDAFKNPDGEVTLYDSTRNVMYLDDGNHLNIFGYEKVRPIYEKLAQELEDELSEMNYEDNQKK